MFPVAGLVLLGREHYMKQNRGVIPPTPRQGIKPQYLGAAPGNSATGCVFNSAT